jgi:hypothetical protein
VSEKNVKTKEKLADKAVSELPSRKKMSVWRKTRAKHLIKRTLDRFYETILLPGLPDGLFSNPKSQFGKILEGLRLENVDIFYGH